MSGIARWADDSSDEEDNYDITKVKENAWAKRRPKTMALSSSVDSNKSTTIQEVEDWIKQRQTKAAGKNTPTRESTEEIWYNEVCNEPEDTWLTKQDEERSYARSTFSSRQRIDENDSNTPRKPMISSPSTPKSSLKPSLNRPAEPYISKYNKNTTPTPKKQSKGISSSHTTNISNTPNRRYHFVVGTPAPEKLETIPSYDDSPRITAAGEDTSQNTNPNRFSLNKPSSNLPSSGSSLAKARQQIPSSGSSLARAKQSIPSSGSSLAKAKQSIPSSGSSLAKASARKYNLLPKDDEIQSYNKYIQTEENESYKQHSRTSTQQYDEKSYRSRNSRQRKDHLYPPSSNLQEMTIAYNLARPHVLDIEDEELSFSSSKYSYTSRDYGTQRSNRPRPNYEDNRNSYRRSNSNHSAGRGRGRNTNGRNTNSARGRGRNNSHPKSAGTTSRFRLVVE